MAFMEINFHSDALGSDTTVNVVVPQRTRGNIGIREGEFGDTYPTLFLLHGMSDDHTIWSRRTSIERYADEQGIAVVMPSTQLGWYTDMKFGPHFRSYIGEELPKIVRGFFPGMSHKREDTYLAGNSMGGYGSLALALTYPETFSIAAPLSGAFDPKWLYKPESPDMNLFYDIFGKIEEFDGSNNDLFHLSKVRREDGSPLPSIYMACGTEDFLYADNRRMKAHLEVLGYDLTYVEKPGSHNWSFWDGEIQAVLNFIDAKRRKES